MINQLTFRGQIFSRNTIGASTLIPPITGEGDLATTPDLFLRSRRQDINFMRWAKWQKAPSFPPFVPPGFVAPRYNCWLDYVKTSDSLGSRVCDISPAPGITNYPPKHAVVNVLFRSAKELPIFGELKQ